ncbi:MAG: ABC transporter substrate-binding protein [Defluviitaleaceae bacterium]|nr:ABC transporter substrate-binding protein [Defluviitaleaceae bacterium]
MKLRKFLMAASVVALGAFFVACGNRNEDAGTGADAVGDVTTPTVTQPGDPEPGRRTFPDFPSGPNASAGRPAGHRADILANMPAFNVNGSINVASGTTASMNMWYGWDNIAVNAQARRMMFEMVSTMESNMGREMFPNPMVIDTSRPDGGLVITDNPDGTRTYTFHINNDNVWSDGRTITAHDYVGGILFDAHPYFIDIAPNAAPGLAPHSLGRREFASGDADVHAGVRLYSATSFSVTVRADYIPFVFEEAVYMNVQPSPLHAMLPGFDPLTQVVDTGYGTYLRGLTHAMVTTGINGVENRVRNLDEDDNYVVDDDGNYVYTLIGGTGFRFEPTVTSGAYMFHSFDPATFTLILVANPLFAGTWDGFVPRIEHVIFSRHFADVVVDVLATGQADMVASQGGGATINEMFDVLVDGGTHTSTAFERNGQGFLRFHVDHGPTQFVEVRQAIKWLIDRDEFKELFTLGHGVMVHAMYGVPHWWTQRAIQQGLYDRLIIYTHNPNRAQELLEQGGWVLNAQGEPFVFYGAGATRYKDVTGLTQFPGELPFADDPLVHTLADGRSLMRLQINWATWNAAENRITEIFEVLVPSQLENAGIYLNTTRRANPLVDLSRAAPDMPYPTFHLFNQGQTFDPRVWQPWHWVDPAQAETNMNMTFSRNPSLFERIEPLRFIETTTDEGEQAFVEKFMYVMEILNYYTLEIPLYADVWYDFYPLWVGNWYNNSIWGFDHAVIRAYDSRP